MHFFAVVKHPFVYLMYQSEIDVQVEGVEPGEKVILNPTDIIQSGTLVK